MSQYEQWSLLLQAFILVAGVATVVVYYRQLKAMEGQLQALLETSTRSSHLDLLNLAIADKDIREVWRAEVPALDSDRFKQHMFVNLHLAHIETLFELGRLSKEQVTAELKEHFANQHYKNFWDCARSHRSAMLNGGSEKKRHFMPSAKMHLIKWPNKALQGTRQKRRAPELCVRRQHTCPRAC